MPATGPKRRSSNDILGMAWIDRGVGGAGADLENYRYPGGSAGPLASWAQKVEATLPGADAYPPTIVIAPIPDSTSGRTVTVTLQWRAPDAVMTSRHVAIGYISDP